MYTYVRTLRWPVCKSKYPIPCIFALWLFALSLKTTHANVRLFIQQQNLSVFTPDLSVSVMVWDSLLGRLAYKFVVAL